MMGIRKMMLKGDEKMSVKRRIMNTRYAGRRYTEKNIHKLFIRLSLNKKDHL